MTLGTGRAGPGRWPAAALLAVVALLLSGCATSGTAPAAGRGGLWAAGIDLTGQTFTVGGREYDEQLLLCRMQILALESVGASVVDRCGIIGADVARRALLSGQIDMYWSYTGTAWINDLGQARPVRGVREQYAATRDLDRARNDVVWTDPTPFDNTYAIATTRSFAERNAIRSTTDWANFVNSGNPEATLCVEPEFAGRDDGLPNLLRAYGVNRPYANPPAVTTVTSALVYRATSQGTPCRFGEVFTTDGRVPGLDLVALPDDRGFFPNYNAANSVRGEVARRAPQVARISDEIARRLDQATMLGLNDQVSSLDQDPAAVASTWLRQQGLIGP